LAHPPQTRQYLGAASQSEHVATCAGSQESVGLLMGYSHPHANENFKWERHDFKWQRHDWAPGLSNSQQDSSLDASAMILHFSVLHLNFQGKSLTDCRLFL
jgi:hypothetical protein